MSDRRDRDREEGAEGDSDLSQVFVTVNGRRLSIATLAQGWVAETSRTKENVTALSNVAVENRDAANSIAAMGRELVRALENLRGVNKENDALRLEIKNIREAIAQVSSNNAVNAALGGTGRQQ